MADELTTDPNVTPESVINDCFGTVDAQLAEMDRAHQERLSTIKADYAARVKHFTDLRDAKPKTPHLTLTDVEKEGYAHVAHMIPDMIVNTSSIRQGEGTRAFRDLLLKLFGTP